MKDTPTQGFRPRLSNREYERLLASRRGDNIGVIADTHAPFTHRSYLDFCSDTFERFGCSIIVHIGDEIDNHAISYHDTDPDGFSPGHEAEAAQAEMDRWYARFPEVRVCIGNHSALPYRKALSKGIPKKFIRAYEEIWNAPKGWRWGWQWELNGVRFQHGTGYSGKTAHERIALENMQSTVMGHAHSYAGVEYRASNAQLIFGMNVGCGLDRHSYAMAYGKDMARKPVLGCGVVLDQGHLAAFMPMNLKS